MAGLLWWSLGVEESSLLHECIKGIKDGRGGRGSSEPRSVKGLSPEVHRPAGVDKEEERPGLMEGGGDQFTQPPQHTHPWTSPLFFGRIHSPTSHRSGMAMLLIESPLSPCMVVPEEHPPPRPARFFPFSRFPTLGGGQVRPQRRDGHGQQGTGRAGRDWSSKKSSAGRGASHLRKGVVITSALNLLFAKPPLEEYSWEGGTGNSHLGGLRV